MGLSFPSSAMPVSPVIKVALIGNSFLYYNDCPRLLEGLAGGSIRQNSCLRGGSDFEDLWKRGNGMSRRFATANALGLDGHYDIGAPTISALLRADSNDFV